MAKSPGLVGESLLGLPKATNRPPNTSSITRNLLVLFVVLLGRSTQHPICFSRTVLCRSGRCRKLPVTNQAR